MVHSLVRRSTVLVIVGLILSLLPPPQARAWPKMPAPQPHPVAQPYTPPAPSHLPDLALAITVARDPIAVGETTVFTATVSNQAPDTATGVTVSLPVPAGVTVVTGAGVPTNGASWQWPTFDLVGNTTTVFTGELRVDQPLKGDALLLEPQATAAELKTPATTRGGALLVETAPAAPATPFTPGKATTLGDATADVIVQLPANASASALLLRQEDTTTTVAAPTPARAQLVRSLRTFSLRAQDLQGNDVHQFGAPLTVVARYTPEQLAVRHIAEVDLALFWFDPDQKEWVPLQSQVDPAAHTVSATVNHFSDFQIGDIYKPSDAYIPSLQGWQVSTFTGAATYSYPIEVPAGPNGIKPDLQLSYNSTGMDGQSGLRPTQQAGWAGRDWSLDTGSIARHKLITSGYGNQYNYYSLILNGQAFDLVRAEPIIGSTGDANDPTQWMWRSTSESYLRVQVVENSTPSTRATLPDSTTGDQVNDPTYGRGGFLNDGPGGTWQPRKRHIWKVWAKDGTRYEFSEDLWNGFNYCGGNIGGWAFDAYKWLLSSVTDTHGNVITYQYGRRSWVGGDTACPLGSGNEGRAVYGTVDQDAWPDTITWGNTGTGDRYKVIFNSIARSGSSQDTDHEKPKYQYGNNGDVGAIGNDSGSPRETRILSMVRVQSRQAATWQTIRQYVFDTDFSTVTDKGTSSDNIVYNPDPTHPKLTLRAIKRYSADVNDDGFGEGPPLPPTTFTYGTDRETSLYAKGGFNRLIGVNNGQGGTITFNYETIGAAVPGSAQLFENNQRVTSKVVTENSRGAANAISSTWGYSYTNPNYNALGSAIAEPGTKGNSALPNSATLYYSYFIDTDLGRRKENTNRLIRPALTEFRGHALVQETDPTGTITKHYFQQGEAGCRPTVTGPSLTAEQCFIDIRNAEFQKGSEYKTEVYTAGGAKMQETENFYAVYLDPSVSVDTYGYEPTSGLWRAFVYTKQTDERLYEGGGVPVGRTTRYCYVESKQGGRQYGNLTHTLTYNQLVAVSAAPLNSCDNPGNAPLPERIARNDYIARNDTAAYIVDRVAQNVVLNGAGQLLAMSEMFYDTQTAIYKGIDTKGDLTLSRRYYDIPTSTDSSYRSTDTSYAYDAYGNRTQVTTYAGAGTRLKTANTYSGPGNGSAARMTTTAYDPTLHVFPISVTQPTVGSVTLAESAGYDYAMGTLTLVTDPNGNVTNAKYDGFGRLVQIAKPGDALDTAPTVKATYHDDEIPFRYETTARADSTSTRTVNQFYDGIGRLIQTRSQSVNGITPQDSVVDKKYDGLGRVTQESQPRYDTQSVAYAPPTGAIRWTTTTYDALGRPLLTTAPDTTTSEHHYGIAEGQRFDDAVDPNRHRSQWRYDNLGRLAKVFEIAGDCASNYWAYTCTGGTTTQWSVYATTTYGYTPLDLLNNVTDGNTNVTQMTYDSAGRKIGMVDPDMGTWSYGYDVNNNLTQQTDAKSQSITFGYDALNRLIGKSYTPAASGANATYTYDQNANGRGQRTGMSNANLSVAWQYDTRGRMSQALYSGITGLPSQSRQFDWEYDSADRVKTITYPAIGAQRDVATYAYDDAWRPKTLTRQINGAPATVENLVSNATYTALDQPAQWTFGNTLAQTWTYNNTMARLSNLQVGAGGALFNRNYTYDNGGNVKTITKPAVETQTFAYDERDRLTSWTIGAPIALTPRGAGHALYQMMAGPRVVDAASTPFWRADTRLTADEATQPEAARVLRADANAMRLPGTQEHAQPAMTAPQPQGTPAPEATGGIPSAAVAPAPVRTPNIGRLPLSFVANQGLADSVVRFLVRGTGGTLFFTPQAAVLTLPDPTNALTGSVVLLSYQGANPAPTLQAGEPLPGVVNSFIGNNPALWRTNLPTYRGVTYQNLYAGIDLQYTGTDGQLKSTYQVAANASPSAIRWRYTGASDVQVDSATGDLRITLRSLGQARTGNTLTEQAPVAWQEVGGQRRPVPVQFQVAADKSVGFTLGSYDRSQPLLIDPVLTYSTYLGGNSTDKGEAITVDASGNAYITGSTTSSNFPVQGAFRGTPVGSEDVFVTKLSADGQTILYSTYLGSTGSDIGYAIKLDSANNIIVAGETDASGFPTTAGGQDTTFGGGTCGSEPCEDGFVTKLNSSGSSLLYSSYIGDNGEDNARSLAVDSSGKLYVTGFTAGNLTTSAGAYDTSFNGGGYDAFFMKLDPTLSGAGSRLYASYFGGADTDFGYGIAVQSNGNVTLAGRTASTTTLAPIFPVKNAYQSTKQGNADAFVARFNPATSGTGALLYSSYVGGAGEDEGNALALDSTGTAYLSGYTQSNPFPLLNAWQSTFGGVRDAFFTRIDPSKTGNASLLYASYVGGSGEDRGLALAVGSNDQVYLTGWTRSGDFPTVAPFQGNNAGGTCGTVPNTYVCADAFVVRFDPTRNTPIYSTYLGGPNAEDEGHGIAADSAAAAYVTGYTKSSTFPTQSPRQGTLGSASGDAFVTKLVLPTVQFTAASQSVSESAGQATINATLSTASTYTVTVQVATANGSAAAGSDYTPINTTLVFAPNATTAQVQVPITNDAVNEPNETFTVALSNPFNASLGTPASQTVTITNDDPQPTLTWQAGSVSASETSGGVALTVQLSAASSTNVTVNYATASGTASAGSDYTTKSGPLTFLPGETAKTVQVVIANDSAQESSETFTVGLSGASNATIGTPSSATVTILDDDTPGAAGSAIYDYDKLGNRYLRGTATSYAAQAGTCAAGPLNKPHAIKTFGTTTFCYDANGNMVSSSAGRSASWNADNQPTSLSENGVSESYTYDGEGERVSRTSGSVTTIYLGGVWEEPVSGGVSGNARMLYSFGGQVVAQRENGANVFFHGDHLGSVSLVTNASGASVGTQEFDPWGKVRSGGVTQTSLNYTGQRLDSTGLLYYGARYYDPTLARFLSADTIVPGMASGSGGGAATLGYDDKVALRHLTVDFHEVGFAAALNRENAFTHGKGFWFQLQGDDRQDAKWQWGPANPQAINRYSYVLNNPLRYTDPTGHVGEDGGNEQVGYKAACKNAKDAIAACGTPGYNNKVSSKDGKADLMFTWSMDENGHIQYKYVWSDQREFQIFQAYVDAMDGALTNILATVAGVTTAGLVGIFACALTGIGCVGLGVTIIIGTVVAIAFYISLINNKNAAMRTFRNMPQAPAYYRPMR